MVIEQNGLAGRASNCILANISTCLRVGLSCGALTLSLSCLKVPCQLSAGEVYATEEHADNWEDLLVDGYLDCDQRDNTAVTQAMTLLTAYDMARLNSALRHVGETQTNGLRYPESMKTYQNQRRPDVHVTIRRKSMSFVKEDEGANDEAIDCSEQLSSAFLAISIICGEDQSTSSRYDLRDDALSYVASMRELSTNDIARLVSYLKEPDETMDEEYVVALKNGVKKLVQRHVGEN